MALTKWRHIFFLIVWSHFASGTGEMRSNYKKKIPLFRQWHWRNAHFASGTGTLASHAFSPLQLSKKYHKLGKIFKKYHKNRKNFKKYHKLGICLIFYHNLVNCPHKSLSPAQTQQRKSKPNDVGHFYFIFYLFL